MQSTKPKTKAPKKGKKKEEIIESESEQEEWEDKPEIKKPTSEKFILYKLLNVQKTATSVQIKTSYKQLALKIHPDKNKDDPDAAQKFNKLTEAYKILIDEEKRKEYDQTGFMPGEFNQETFQSAYEYYRKLYKKVEKQDIQAFSKRYRFGQMEEEDLMEFYNDHGGDMTHLLQSIPLSQSEDIPRFIKFYENAIKEERLEATSKFEKTKNKIRPLRNQEKDAKKQQEKRKKTTQNDMEALVKAIQNKQTNSFVEMLEKKYGADPKKKKSKA